MVELGASDETCIGQRDRPIRKTNKPAAIAVMLASNSVAAIVAARNARTLRQLR